MKIKLFRKKAVKAVALFLAGNILLECFFPAVAYALTSGPSQPELQSFEPVGTTQMVNLFTGDFTYNIPLIELPGPNGGYPFNLAYNAGIGMDQEASWVGLGWNLNPGAISRQMRGLPDDFNGDKVTKKMHIKDNVTFGLGAGANVELFGADFAKTGKISNAGSVGLGIDVFYNNYKGFGYSISPSLNFTKGISDKLGADVGLSMSLNSQEGVSMQPSVGFTSAYEGKLDDGDVWGKNSSSISMGYNSSVGLTGMSLGMSTTEYQGKLNKDPKKTEINGRSGTSYSSTLSLFSPGFSPKVSMPMVGANGTLEIKPGVEIFGGHGHLSAKGYFSFQRLKNKGKFIEYDAYGYLNYQNKSEAPASLNPLSDNFYSKDMIDFNRENDGTLRKETPYLATPNMTYDIYSVNGQGISAMYRPYRNDIGVFSDPAQNSIIGGAEVGFDVGGGATAKGGLNITGNISTTQSGMWKNGNQVKDQIPFKNKQNNSLFEPAYFKAFGEHTMDLKDAGKGVSKELDAVGGEEPVRIGLSNHTATATIKDDNDKVNKSLAQPDEARSPKNTSIQPLTNDKIQGGNGPGIFRIDYYNGVNQSSGVAINSKSSFNRTDAQYKSNHIGAFVANNTDGLRYVYALPAYNKNKEDVQFSVLRNNNTKKEYPVVPGSSTLDYKASGTDQFLSQTILPPYAHSYLLTGIVGNDYVDLTGDGITNDDLGYWVKFTYSKANDYKWRAPYFGYSHNPGFRTDPLDDKGSYTAGEKEMWYLTSAETKSHIAYFKLKQRVDGYGAGSFSENKQEYTSGLTMFGNAKMYQLEEVSLFTKEEIKRADNSNLVDDNPVPIKTVHFAYSNKLCQNTANNINTYSGGGETGKLTLEKVWFSFNGSEKGKISPYQFDYHHNDPANGENPDYNIYQYDRWGNYKPYPTTWDGQDGTDWTNRRAFNTDNPYVNQEGANDDLEEYNKNAGVWSLKEIKLPSGSKINIEYEGDDYAYVQDRLAMQMTPITGIGSLTDNPNKLYDEENGKENDTRIYFKLKNPVPISGTSDDDQLKEVKKYLDSETDKLYYKIRIQLRKQSENQMDFIAGYVTIAPEDDGQGNSTMGLESYQNSTHFTHGYFNIEKEDGHHPFSLAGWQHMRTNQPKLAAIGGKVNMNDDPSKENKVQRIKSLGSAFTTITQIFKGYNNFAKKKKWGMYLDEIHPTDMTNNKSFVRLVSPDRKKRGGGVRVRQITLSDEWSTMDPNGKSSIYGQVYDYSTTDGEGNEISSGVAAYEPMVGGDENPLHLPEKYTEKVKLKSDNDFYFEYPINESLYPGPSVGYSKVAIMSLASAAKWKPERVKIPSDWNIDLDYFTKQADPGAPIPKGFYATTGVTVNEFYTAKDFPVVTRSTKVDQTIPPKIWIPIPFLGSITSSKMTVSQGFVTMLNDMHGKQKKVTSYGQDLNGNIVWDKIVSGSEYIYQFSEGSYKPGGMDKVKPVKILDNTVKVPIYNNGVITGDTEKVLGVDHDFIVDMRQNKTSGKEVNVRTNVDLVGFAIFSIPVPSVWPTISSTNTRVRTAVTNKIIHKAGILKSVVATDGMSVVQTDNELWDSETGEVLLTSVNNNFGDKVYNYAIPAYTQYDRMGAAYKNLGLTIDIRFKRAENKPRYFEPINSIGAVADLLVKGDEFILENGQAVITYTGKANGIPQFYSRSDLDLVASTEDVEIYLYRSGRRNLLSAKAGSIVSLDDPTLPKQIENLPGKTIEVPAAN